MKLPWSKSSDTTPATASNLPDDAATDDGVPKGYTPKKGRPTPKRNQVERAKGVRIEPLVTHAAPTISKEERKQQKASMTKEEWKAHKKRVKEQRKKIRQEYRAAMDRGDEGYLLDRDRGPEKKFIRDWIDSRRFFSELLMPVAFVLLVLMFIGQKWPSIATGSSLFGMMMILGFAIEAVIIFRRAPKACRKEFPHHTFTDRSLGFYAYMRATQIRKLRTPKPTVSPR